MNKSDNYDLFQYSRDVFTESQFATSFLQVLVEERRKLYQERHNSTITATTSLKVEDIVKAHVKVQSKGKSVIVKDLSYQAKVPFIVTKDLHHNAFEVKLYNQPNGATRKYKATELYLLLSSLDPSEPLNTINQRYLNYEHAPILHPLKKSMQIGLHNNTYFHPKPSTIQAKPSNKPSMHIENLIF